MLKTGHQHESRDLSIWVLALLVNTCKSRVVTFECSVKLKTGFEISNLISISPNGKALENMAGEVYGLEKAQTLPLSSG